MRRVWYKKQMEQAANVDEDVKFVPGHGITMNVDYTGGSPQYFFSVESNYYDWDLVGAIMEDFMELLWDDGYVSGLFKHKSAKLF